MKKIEMAELFEPVEIGLWGQHYEVLLATKQIEGKVGQALTAVVAADQMEPETAEGATEDELQVFSDAERLKKVDIYAAAIDTVLKPLDQDNNGDGPSKAPRAKTHLVKLYKAGDIGLVHLEAAFEQVFEAYQGRNRPTQSSSDRTES